MDYEKMTKKELIALLEKKENELKINYQGIKEKDVIIQKERENVKKSEEDFENLEQNVSNIIQQEINKVHSSYGDIQKKYSQMVLDKQKSDNGVLSFYSVIQGIKEIKNTQNKVIDDMIELIEGHYVINEGSK